tara:strand:- start:249 stop:554 length:306 start_codon:yes stop_codon:yes gene_type:complete
MPVLGTQVIKSIQRGFTTATVAVTINSVDTTKSFTTSSFANAGYRGQLDTSDSGAYGIMGKSAWAQLYDATTVAVGQGSGNAIQNITQANAVVYWEVVEYV